MKILTVVGARPQFIKAAAVSLALREHGLGAVIEEVMVHTGQHYDQSLSEVFFDELRMPEPAYELSVGSATHGQQTADIMARLEPIVVECAPHAMLVYGDTNSTLGGALVAAKLHVPVAHVEAGLRSFDKRMPEEINRVLTDHVSDLLLCPSRQAIANLTSEGVTENVEFTGDVMHGVLMRTAASLRGDNPVAARLGLDGERYVAVTMHRASNTDEPRRAFAVVDALSALADDGYHVVFPVHPRTRRVIEPSWVRSSRVQMIEPLGYRDMVALTRGASVVVTDSGGLQKEAVWLGVPCVTIRDETEWVETVAAGWNVLAGTDPARIVAAVHAAKAPAEPFDEYGSADAAGNVVAALIARYG
jgi:UDP-N-acetylglucosamine 2-epimerase